MKGILSSAALVLGVFAAGTMAPQNLYAGWGPAAKKAVRADRPMGRSGGGWGPGAARRTGGAQQPTVSWDGADSASLEKAANSGKPIVVLFPKEGTDITTYFMGQEYVDMKDVDAVFVAVPYTSDRAPAPGAKESIVPVNKLSSDNPARDVGHALGQEAVYIFDCFGNYSTDIGMKFTSKPTAKQLKDALARIPSKIEALTKKHQKNLDNANAALAKGDRNGAFKLAVKILETELTGYSFASEAAQIYNTICDEVRGEITALKDGDVKESQKKLGELSSVFTKKTAPAIASEIAAAKKELSTVSK